MHFPITLLIYHNHNLSSICLLRLRFSLLGHYFQIQKSLLNLRSASFPEDYGQRQWMWLWRCLFKTLHTSINHPDVHVVGSIFVSSLFLLCFCSSRTVCLCLAHMPCRGRCLLRSSAAHPDNLVMPHPCQPSVIFLFKSEDICHYIHSAVNSYCDCMVSFI